MSSTQAIANFQAKLESLSFKEGEEWENHISLFLSMLDELAAQYQVMDDSEKVTKLLRTLPASFNALAMASTLTTTTFDELFSAVQANIGRRKNLGMCNKASSSIIQGPSAQLADGFQNIESPSGNYTSGRGRGRGNFKFRRVGSGHRGRGRGGRRGIRYHYDSHGFHYCHKPGHFIKFCLLRQQIEGSVQHRSQLINHNASRNQ